MTAIITNKFRTEAASSFKSKLDDSSPTADNYYLFIAKPTPWSKESVNPDDFPDTPLDTVSGEREIWENMLGVKKILPNNSSFVIRRFNWDSTLNTVYVAYSDQDANQFMHPTPSEIADGITNNYIPASFYVMNQFFQVFKCLSNNNKSKSLIEPVANESTPLVLLNLSDGYTWKYMFTLNTADSLQYLTDSWMPVKTLVADDGSTQWSVQQGALNTGVIDSIIVENGGSGYNRVLDTTTVENIGVSGPNQTIGVPSNVNASSNNAWYSGATVWITAGTGLGSSSKVLNYLGSTKEFVLETTLTIDLTSQFQILPTVNIVGDGINAKAKALVNFISPSSIISVQLINQGVGYNYATCTITGGISGSNFATVVAVLPPEQGHGADPVAELGGTFLMISTKISYNEGSGDFPISNDYRQLGIIKNPAVYNDVNTKFTGLTGKASTRLNLSSVVGSFTLDSVISENSPGTAQAIVLEQLVNDLNIIQDRTTGFDDFTVSNIITAVGASGTISSIVPPEIEKYTGDVLYFQNRRRITRDPSQLETIRIIIAF